MNPFDAVKEFIEASGVSKDTDLWATGLREELAETREAAANLLKEICDLLYIMTGYAIAGGFPEVLEPPKEHLALGQDVANFMDAMVAMFPDDVVEEAFKRVHASNMTKAPWLTREDGKVLKGPNYVPPNLSDLIP